MELSLKESKQRQPERRDNKEKQRDKDKEKDLEKDKDTEKDKDKEKKPRKRSQSPIATKEELTSKKIQLIVYVGNLPTSWKQDDIWTFFEEFGKILDVKLIRKTYGFTGSSLVKFASLTNAEDAVEKLKNTIIPGATRPVNIKWLDTEEQRLSLGQYNDHKLFVGSLPRQASRESLYQVFSLLGQIQSIRLEETQFWAFVDYKNKESALLAIKFLNGQTYLHGSRIPIQVRFKEKKYNSYMAKKHEKEDLDPFAYSIDNIYHQIYHEGQHYYYNYKSKLSQFQAPPPGAKVFNTNSAEGYYIQQEVNSLNDMHNSNRKLGPPGSNLFLFHLPNNMKDSELYNIFRRFGNIYSTRVMTEKNGKSKGIGFVSFDNSKSALQAIEEMNGFEVRGKRLKVELNKKDEKAITNNVSSLVQARYDF